MNAHSDDRGSGDSLMFIGACSRGEKFQKYLGMVTYKSVLAMLIRENAIYGDATFTDRSPISHGSATRSA
ncbi:hypothetical protein Airi02_042380 [Actinoallomurus iriomotensis]|uniref:Uncharacterized protein n=1 Tax=Actinoallomurus iriomotensis TaxID=478107 RepID=A0A9W6S3B6_9ACTN|nr:hypothetical protein Airi02_042380 [Actinoallomurus iriomotensis]